MLEIVFRGVCIFFIYFLRNELKVSCEDGENKILIGSVFSSLSLLYGQLMNNYYWSYYAQFTTLIYLVLEMPLEADVWILSLTFKDSLGH